MSALERYSQSHNNDDTQRLVFKNKKNYSQSQITPPTIYPLSPLSALESRRPDKSYVAPEMPASFNWSDYRDYLMLNITNNNLLAVGLVCGKLNLALLSSITAFKLLDECLHICRRFNRDKIALALLAIWNYTGDPQTDTLLDCLGYDVIHDDNAHYLLSLFPKSSFSTYIIDLAERPQGEYQHIAIPRLYRFFKYSLTAQIVRDLVDVTADMQSGATSGELRWVLALISKRNNENIAPRPEWIRNFLIAQPIPGKCLATIGLNFISTDIEYTGYLGQSHKSLNSQNKSLTSVQGKDSSIDTVSSITYQPAILPYVLQTNTDIEDMKQIFSTIYSNLSDIDYISMAIDWRMNYSPPTTSEAVAELTAGAKIIIDEDQGYNNLEYVKYIRTSVSETYNNLTQEQRYQMMLPAWRVKIGYQLQSDVGLFRLFGPSNPPFGTTYPIEQSSPTRICALYGGCRMLLCVCSDDTRYIADEDADIGEIENEVVGKQITRDWFTGNCQKCGQRILHKSHAVRIPIGDGGWTGTYCNWKCVRSTLPNININDSKVLENLLDNYPFAMAQHHFVTVCNSMCNKYGIQNYS